VGSVSVERVFSAMPLINIDLHSKMEDELLNDLMICYIEKEIFIRNIRNDKIIQRFEEMRKTLVPQNKVVV